MNANGNCEHREWIPTTTDFETVSWDGQPLILRDLPAKSCPLCNETIVEADEVVRAEQKVTAARLGLSPREANILLFLHAPGPRFTESGYIEEKYRFNKMLFKLWKELDNEGLGQSFLHDGFRADRRGPVPENLGEDSASLETKGLVKMRWGGKTAKTSYRWDLTPEGHELARQLFELTPQAMRDAVSKTKAELFLLDSTQLKHKIHDEFPEYKRRYAVEDKE